MRVGVLLAVAVVATLAVFFWPGDDEPGVVPASVVNPTVVDSAITPKEVSDRVREAMMDGDSVRVEYRPGVGKGEDREFWSRPMTERDREWSLRQVARIISTTDSVFDLPKSEALEMEHRMAEMFRIRVMAEAAQKLIDEKRGFVTKGYVSALTSDDEWHYWNLSMFYKDEGNRCLYVPINLNEFPLVRDWRRRADEIAEFVKQDKGYKWNGLDYAVRKELVDAAVAAHARLPALEDELAELRLIPVEDRTAEQVARWHVLGPQVAECYEATRKVPPYYDPTTLEWRFQ